MAEPLLGGIPVAAKTALATGAENMTHAEAGVMGAAPLGADYETAGKASATGFTGLFAEVAKRYEERHGAGAGNLSDVLGTIAAKNHRPGVDNPCAQLREDLGGEFCQRASRGRASACSKLPEKSNAGSDAADAGRRNGPYLTPRCFLCAAQNV